MPPFFFFIVILAVVARGDYLMTTYFIGSSCTGLPGLSAIDYNCQYNSATGYFQTLTCGTTGTPTINLYNVSSCNSTLPTASDIMPATLFGCNVTGAFSSVQKTCVAGSGLIPPPDQAFLMDYSAPNFCPLSFNNTLIQTTMVPLGSCISRPKGGGNFNTVLASCDSTAALISVLIFSSKDCGGEPPFTELIPTNNCTLDGRSPRIALCAPSSKSRTPSPLSTPSATSTPTLSLGYSPSNTPTATQNCTRSGTGTPSFSSTFTPSSTPTPTLTTFGTPVSATPFLIVGDSPSSSFTATQSQTPNFTFTLTGHFNATVSAGTIPTSSRSGTQTRVVLQGLSLSNTGSKSSSSSSTPSQSVVFVNRSNSSSLSFSPSARVNLGGGLLGVSSPTNVSAADVAKGAESTSASNSTHQFPGIVAGSVVGGLVIVVLLVCATLYCIVAQRKHRKAEARRSMFFTGREVKEAAHISDSADIKTSVNVAASLWKEEGRIAIESPIWTVRGGSPADGVYPSSPNSVN